MATKEAAEGIEGKRDSLSDECLVRGAWMAGRPTDPLGVRIWALNDALPEGQLATPHL